jgi:putative phosphoesterase
MKIVLLADIHGNSIALCAVLDDIQPQEADMYLILGDIVDGHEPSVVLDVVSKLRNVRCITGNTEGYITTGEGPPSLSVSNVVNRPELIGKFQEATASFAWTKGALCATGWFEYLCDLPVEERLELPDGRTLLAVHSSPGFADGPGIAPHTTDSEMDELLYGCDAEVICVGHTHLPFIRNYNKTLVINPGSVSNPLAPDLRASYAILNATADGLEVVHRRVAYDHAVVVEEVRKSHHPAADFIIDHQLGKYTVEDLMRVAQSRMHLVKSRRSNKSAIQGAPTA